MTIAEVVRKEKHNKDEFLKMREDCIQVAGNLRHTKLSDMDIADGMLVWVIEYYHKRFNGIRKALEKEVVITTKFLTIDSGELVRHRLINKEAKHG